MDIRKRILALAVVAAAAPAAFADNFVGGELGFETHPVNSSRTREEVRREYLAFRDHPVLADGTVVLQGDAGYVSPVQGAFADRDPAGPHTHAMANRGTQAAAAPAPLSEAERRVYREQYVN
jgi:hypothetical protein